MANEHSIRVSARGEFGQLENGLKNLQKDLKSVLGEIDKGARRGGLFDDTQLRALDVYRARFKQSMGEVERELQKQNDTIDQLHRRRENSSRSEQEAIDKEIRRREKALDILRRQIRMVEDLNNKRNKEAKTYGTVPSASTGGMPSSGMGGGATGGIFGSAMAKALGLGKFMIGLAGIGGIASMASQAYGLAYASQVTPMNLSQRIRGHGYSGSAKNMWDEIGQTGRNSGMGYTSAESWQFMDAYSRRGGGMNRFGLESSLMFGRAYGLEAGETADVLGTNRALGGTTSPQAFANMIAVSVANSGMTPRILEVMETSNGLLEQMNTSLKDGGSKSILAYQTTLDRIGNEKGMMRLTGQQGANIISGMGGIFNPGQDNPWKWMGIQALQQYNPGKYGKMGLYDLETSFESGLENTDNVAAMAKYLRGKSGGDENTMKRMLQRWLQDGGYNATKQQVNDLYSATNGFTSFDSGKINGVMGQLEKGDGTAKYQERMGQIGQGILDTNARFEKQLENLGQPLLVVVQGIKAGITDLLEELTSDGDITVQLKGVLDDIKKFMDDNLIGLATAAGLVALAPAIAKALGGGGGGNGKNSSNSSKVPPIIAGGSIWKTLLKGFGLFGTGKSAVDAFDMEKHRKWAKESGLDPKDISWFDAFSAEMADFFSFGLFNQKEFYEMFSEESKNKFAGKMDKFFKTLFPEAPKSKEDKEKFKNFAEGKTADGKSYRPLSWSQYANPSNWGKSTNDPKEKNIWSGGFNFGGKDGVTVDTRTNLDKAVESLKTLGSSGLVSINGMTDIGKQKLKELADQGLVKLAEGQTVQYAMMSGFTDKGKAELQRLADKGIISISGFQTDGTAKVTALSEEGKVALQTLKKDGLVNISDFKTENTKVITGMTTEGSKQLTQLQKNGSLSMDGMDKTTDKKLENMRKKTETKLGDIHKEHTTFKDKTVGKDGIFQKWADGFGKLWDDFVKSIKDLLPSWLGGGGDSTIGGGGFGANYDVRTQSGVSGKALDKKLGGVLAGRGDDFVAAGKKYGIDPAVLAAIAMHETGNGTSPAVRNKNNVGGMMKPGGGLMSFGSIGQGIEAFASNLKRLYIDQGLVTIAQIQKKYAPIGAGNDPTGLNKNWVNGVVSYANGFGVANNAFSTKGSFFDNWESRITSHFGDTAGRGGKGHGGLDIKGKQGDALQAVMGGTVAFLYKDPNNKRAGGTELGIKTPDGKTYFYSHMSNVADGLKVGSTVQAGQYVGNVGGTPGMAGSGYSTTGSHLHLGLLDAKGNRINPETWLRNMNKGDSDIGLMQAMMGGGANWVQSGTTVKDINVTVTFEGDGAEKLNAATESTLQKMIQQAIQNYETQKLLLNPSM